MGATATAAKGKRKPKDPSMAAEDPDVIEVPSKTISMQSALAQCLLQY